MSKKHVCPWMQIGENRSHLNEYQAILVEGSPACLETLPQDFLEEWKSSQSGAGVFHFAASQGLAPDTTIEFLIQRGIDPNGISLKGVSVLGHALNRSREAAVAWCKGLLAAGARVDLMPCKGTSMLLAGVQSNRLELIEMAVKGGAQRVYPPGLQFQHSPTPESHKLFYSQPDNVKEGALAMERLLPPAQVDLDRQWLMSVRSPKFPWMAHWIEAGANVLAVDASGNNALHLLADFLSFEGQYRFRDTAAFEWIEKLCAMGVGVQALNNDGQSPLDVFNRREGELEESLNAHFLRSIHNGQAKFIHQMTPPASASNRRIRL